MKKVIFFYQYQVSDSDAPTMKNGTVNLKQSELLHIPGLGFDGLVGYSPIAMTKNAMNKAYWHTFQVLTKRPERVLEMDRAGLLKWGTNIWMGTTVENSKYIERIEVLRNTNANIKFLSCEPLLGSLKDISLEEINWVIVGGESGPKSREMKKEWVLELKDLCEKDNVAFFFKQWGGINKKKSGRLLDGRTYDAYPIIP